MSMLAIAQHANMVIGKLLGQAELQAKLQSALVVEQRKTNELLERLLSQR